jgi:uncharacterized membrane protein YoaK (UPF0700 family)
VLDDWRHGGDQWGQLSRRLVWGPSIVTRLAALLAVIAGSADVIGFLGYGGLFFGNMSGNVALLAVHTLGGVPASMTHLLAVPVFIAAVIGTKVGTIFAGGSPTRAMRPLLVVAALLFVAAMALRVALVGVAAMGVLSALAVEVYPGRPSTTVMTTNLIQLFVAPSWGTAIEFTGFIVGCGLGALAGATVGRWALALPVLLVLWALAMTYYSGEIRRVLARP